MLGLPRAERETTGPLRIVHEAHKSSLRICLTENWPQVQLFEAWARRKLKRKEAVSTTQPTVSLARPNEERARVTI